MFGKNKFVAWLAMGLVAVVFFTGGYFVGQDQATMSIRAQADNNKSIIRAYIDTWNQAFKTGDSTPITAFYSPNVTYDFPALPENANALAALRGGFSADLAAVPDAHLDILDMVSEGNKVVFRVRLTGTNTGPIFGLPATGKKLSNTSLNVITLEDGKFVSIVETPDVYTLIQQLGLTIALGPAK
jgi:steroid delta-isomerase-like uncharacterized protein